MFLYIKYEDTIETGELDIVEDQDQESELIIGKIKLHFISW